jgi:hypothetical protein
MNLQSLAHVIQEHVIDLQSFGIKLHPNQPTTNNYIERERKEERRRSAHTRALISCFFEKEG